MWAALCGVSAEDWAAAWADRIGPPEPPGSGRTRNYICRACDVSGNALDDDSLACWLCGSADDLVMDKSPTVTSPHTRREAYMPGGYGAIDEVATLVG